MKNPIIYSLLYINLVYFSSAWEKYDYPEFQNLSDIEFNSIYLNLELTDLSQKFIAKDYSLFTSIGLMPESFDSRVRWENCVHPVINQLFCGSCYAVSAASVLSDRFCVASQGKINVNLSPQYMISCNPWTEGCGGGGLYGTWFFLEQAGLPTDSCVPYFSFMGDEFPCNYNDCVDGTNFYKYYAKMGSTHIFKSSEAIKLDVFMNGPIQVGFWIYGDFKRYKSGVYSPENRTVVGAHAAKLIGWGVENGEEYWILGNSWGVSWGENGYVRMKTGIGALENNAIVGLPDIF